jgi:excisionase family DNA binding protein
MQTHHENELLTVPSFASALNVTPACVRRWLLERKIDAMKIGRLVRIPAREVDRLLAEGLRPRREGRG